MSDMCPGAFAPFLPFRVSDLMKHTRMAECEMLLSAAYVAFSHVQYDRDCLKVSHMFERLRCGKQTIFRAKAET